MLLFPEFIYLSQFNKLSPFKNMLFLIKFKIKSVLIIFNFTFLTINNQQTNKNIQNHHRSIQAHAIQMQTQALNQDQQHEFTGVTVKVINVSGIKSEVDGAEVFVRVKCHDKDGDTRKKVNDRDTVTFDENFFYNTTEILDDDVVFELYQLIQGQGISKNLVGSKASQSRLGNSKVYDADGKFLGATKVTQISRLKRQSQEKSLDLLSEKNTVIGKINVGFDFLERQDIVGGIRCPNLSLKPGATQKKLTLENKYAAYKNLYSFLDGNQTPNCEFFPRKFHH